MTSAYSARPARQGERYNASAVRTNDKGIGRRTDPIFMNARERMGIQKRRRRRRFFLVLFVVFIASVAGNDDYYAANNDDAAANDDAVAANDDAAKAAADDDAYYAANDDDAYYAANDDDGNAGEVNGDGGGEDDAYKQEQEQYQVQDDDIFHWDENVGFDGVSVMPLSCINYNSGHSIKFQLFDTAQSYQCHMGEISTFVVSISRYMRAYFNYQALLLGEEFTLPSDAGFLNCVELQQTYNDRPLYAKIGCMDRETFTSTKLQLHVYTDQQCSQALDDGQTAREHAWRGYILGGGNRVSTQVSFKPEFYSCQSCAPDSIAESFNKMNSNWYDDDYISHHGNKEATNDDGNNGDDDATVDDQYYTAQDDANYQSNNDDAAAAGDDAVAAADDGGDDYYRGRKLVAAAAQPGVLESFHQEFWTEVHSHVRKLEDHDYYDVGDWNMCQRVYKYGMWCDEECRSLDFFRRDQWSRSDIVLVVVMSTFLTAMMLLIVAKRLKAQQKARIYGDEYSSMPGLPPCGMAIIFLMIMGVIVGMAKLKFINETLVFAVVTCILLFIYMLKLTLFEKRRPVLLAAPRHDMFDNPLDDHLFD